MSSRSALLVAVVVTGVALALAIRWQPTPLALPPDPVAIGVIATAEVIDRRFAATLELTIAPGKFLDSNGRSGIVTALPSENSPRLQSGDVAVEVEGQSIRLLATSIPLYRPITSQTRGSDVAALQQALTELSIYDGPIDGRSGRATMTAIGEFLSFVQQPRMLAPTDVLWLNPELGSSFTVESSNAVIGRQLPPQGTPLFVGPETVSHARVRASTLPPGATFIFESADGTFSLNVDESLEVVNLPSVNWREFRGADAALVQIEGSIAQPTPQEVLVVPTQAIVVAIDGTTCLWKIQADEVITVDVLGSSVVGTTYLRPDRTLDGQEVIGNPADVGHNTCSV